MPHIRRQRGWEIPDHRLTPEHVYLGRRKFLAALGLGSIAAGLGAGLGGLASACRADDKPAAPAAPFDPLHSYGPDPLPAARTKPYPAARNQKYTLDRKLTSEKTACTYNNFYEFTANKMAVARRAKDFSTVPWAVEVAGLVAKPRAIDFDQLLATMPIEERTYRHRCVEAWSMAVPWSGFALKRLIDLCEPTGNAKFVRFVSVNRPEQMPGIKAQKWYPWPYFEGLSMAEATNELAFCVTGVYGHPLPNSHGAPLRLAIPWKYGYKSAKSVVKLEFIAEQPETFWHQLAPDEYSFESNVDPDKPHPRWSQATERLIDTGEKVPTQKYNGYGEFVAGLYK